MDGNGGKGKGKAKAEGVDEGQTTVPGAKLTDNMVESLLRMNPSLQSELAGMDKKKAAEVLRNMDVSQLMTGLTMNPKNQKDMASFKFWQTQPVIRFDDKGEVVDGPIKQINIDEVSKTPDQLIEGFEWVTLDLDDEEELRELYELLTNHYVEDGSAMFRFNYSRPFLNWLGLEYRPFLICAAWLTPCLGH